MSLGKRVLVLRDVTERVEGLWEGLAKLVGTDELLIYEELTKLCSSDLGDKVSNIFGDGMAVERITNILRVKLSVTQGAVAERRVGRVVLGKDLVCNV